MDKSPRNLHLLVILLCLFNICSAQNIPELISFENSECRSFFKSVEKPRNVKFNLKDRITHIERYGDVLILELLLKENCSVADHSAGNFSIIGDTLRMEHFKPDTNADTSIVYTEEGDTIFLISNTSVNYEYCDCFFCYKYILRNIPESISFYKVNGIDIYFSNETFKKSLVTYDIFRGDTINYSDEYGRKQGLYMSFNNLNQIRDSLIFVDDDIIAGMKKIEYFENGNIKHYHKISNQMINSTEENYYLLLYTEFFENGQKMKECLCPFDRSCWGCRGIEKYKIWDEKGNLIIDTLTPAK